MLLNGSINKNVFKIYLSRSIDPGKMTKVRVCGNANNFSIESLKVLNSITECDDLGRANEGAE